MRKALIGLILAASAMTAPGIAHAQMVERDEPMLERYKQQGERNAARVQERRERAQQRQEARQERIERRQERRQAAPAPVVREAQRDERRRDRGERRRGGDSTIDRAWRGDRNDPRMEEHRRRYERLERENRREARRDRDGDRWDDRRDRNRDRWDDRRDRNRDRWGDRDRRGDRWGDHRRWDRSWRYDRRYAWRDWRRGNRHLYRLPRYYAPYRGHSYSRFSIGIHLGRPFYGQRYWINDPWRYRLPHAPAGYQWVRYYDDVLLVDTWSGEVVDVIHDFFW